MAVVGKENGKDNDGREKAVGKFEKMEKGLRHYHEHDEAVSQEMNVKLN